MIDFSDWKEYEGSSEGSGRSEKIWLINPNTQQIGLFKFKRDNTTTDHVSECIAYNLSKLLNIDCAKFDLGTYNGREGSMSYNMVEENQILIEGINYITLKYPFYNADTLIDDASGKKYSLEMIKECIPDMFKDFLIIPIFDFLIGNTDRHQNNWAIIFNNKNNVNKIAPLYDNSSSLCAFIKPSDIPICLGKDKMKWDSVVNRKSRSMIRRTCYEDRRPTHLEVLEYINNNYHEITKEYVNNIITNVTVQNIENILNEFPDEILTKEKKRLILKFLNEKVQLLGQMYFKRI